MDARGWVTEFRCMNLNIALRKKMSRDLGLNSSEDGTHIRNNLKEIVLFEVLIEESGWLENPREVRETFVSLDGKDELCENIVEYWKLCGLNRDQGVQQLSKQEAVKFKDISMLKRDSDETVKEICTMIKELREMIKNISDDNSLKSYISNHFDTDIRMSKKLSIVSNFYENVRQMLTSQSRDTFEEGDEEEENSQPEPDQE